MARSLRSLRQVATLRHGLMACRFAPAFRVCGKWSLGLMPFGLESFGLIQLVTWPNFFKLSVLGFGHLA